MMSLKPLRAALTLKPFRAFWIRMSDGREYRISHPEVIAIVPGDKIVIVGTDDEGFDLLDVLHITSIHHGNGRPARPRPTSRN